MKTMRLVDLLDRCRILTGMPPAGKGDVLRELARAAAVHDPAINDEEIMAALERRERLGPFSLGRGIAFPHARVEKEMGFSISVGLIPDGCDFKSPDGRPVRIVILFVVPKSFSDLYLKALAAFLNYFSSEERRNGVVAAASPDEVIRLISADAQTISAE